MSGRKRKPPEWRIVDPCGSYLRILHVDVDVAVWDCTSRLYARKRAA